MFVKCQTRASLFHSWTLSSIQCKNYGMTAGYLSVPKVIFFSDGLSNPVLCCVIAMCKEEEIGRGVTESWQVASKYGAGSFGSLLHILQR